ncbi:MAG: hypothetical protein DMC59_09460 [Verrucomicrobia bacterium]|nr:MAG: hypothetical protein DMC59_09460 [Verrucomicrobiota bacterium]
MNLEAINALAQLIAAIGVIVSLFYLAAQIRQNTQSQRSVVVDSLTSSLINLLGPQASDPKLTRAFASATEDWHGASEEDRTRAIAVLFALFKLFENAWFQQRQGTLDPQQWKGWELYMLAYFHQPGVRTWWAMRRATFAPGFCAYLENSKPVSDVPSPSRMIRGQP